MSRSLWKGLHCDLALSLYTNKKWDLRYKNNRQVKIRLFNRNSLILKKHDGLLVKIYNGFKYAYKRINEDCKHRKYGEFAVTTQMGSVIHSKSKYKKRFKFYD